MDISNSIFYSINFDTLKTSFEGVLKSAVEKYWEQDVKVILEAVNDFRELRQELLTINTDFFSSQVKVENHNHVVIRLSKKFASNFLSSALGVDENNKRFKLSAMTPLEIKLLNNFSEFIYKKINTILIPVKEAKISDESTKSLNLIFLVQLKDKGSSRIVLSVPKDRLNLVELQKTQAFKDEDFLTSNTYVKVKAGTTRITLDELKNLSKEDIILLDDSSSTKLTLISGDVELDFKVKIDPSIILDINSGQEEDYNYEDRFEVEMNKNVWDDIQIEISAEFEKVKMTIGELKQITKGQTVDLGSVFSHEISLFVENKKVAKGELVIINDRYAVKLNEVLANKSNKIVEQTEKKPIEAKTTVEEKKPVEQNKPKPVEEPNETKDEEFDYSDFEK